MQACKLLNSIVFQPLHRYGSNLHSREAMLWLFQRIQVRQCSRRRTMHQVDSVSDQFMISKVLAFHGGVFFCQQRVFNTNNAWFHS
ncbi:hypothetical protein Y032_0256g360 [Ancylostoma ceylanicum]|uniref:Uncharacterized protein n=1 Tax=Ancylostoma ceylanicum TaxID=53326 RepID=A0A016SAY3_9BILA|nr:hypothetical protein Y032_0256g360 [Ancylostoma ceylanicum]